MKYAGEQFDPEKQRQEPDTAQIRRRPFDTSGLHDIPQPRSDDPPYQDWWVVENGNRNGGGN